MKQLLGGPLTGGPHGLRSPPRSGSHPRLRTNGSGTSATTRPAGGHGTNHPCRVWATRRHHTDRARLHGQRQPAANASSITPRFPTTPRGSINKARSTSDALLPTIFTSASGQQEGPSRHSPEISGRVLARHNTRTLTPPPQQPQTPATSPVRRPSSPPPMSLRHHHVLIQRGVQHLRNHAGASMLLATAFFLSSVPSQELQEADAAVIASGGPCCHYTSAWDSTVTPTPRQ